MAIITLTTDFGVRDHYVACMKGVILGIAPKATIVDVTHDIEPHKVSQGAFVLRQTMPWFAPGTIHVVVVDPGVGTTRRIIVAQYADQYVIAPDNGLISMVHQQWPVQAVHVLQNPKMMLPRISSTFHGRDVMGPAAAHLASGAKLSAVGPATDRLEILQEMRAEVLPDRTLRGRVVHTDSFGNLITNISADDLALTYRNHPRAEVYVDDVGVGVLRGAYDEADVGEPLALVGGTNLMEVSVNRGNASQRFEPGEDTVVAVR